MKRRLRYGMLGGAPGAFIGGIHRAAIRLNGNADLVAGCFSSDAAKRAESAREFGIAAGRNYDSYEAMAEAESRREDPIDWVDIVTPNYLHYPAAKLFLEKGISVSCEKPLCFTVEEALELKRVARENGCLFCVAYTYTGHLMAREARRIVAGGELGKIHMVMGEYSQDGLLRAMKSNISKGPRRWRLDPQKSGRGGTVADVGTHIESMVSYITGLKITELCCNLERFSGDFPVDNNVMCLVKYDGGANGVYWASQAAVGSDNMVRIRVIGDNGSLEFNQEQSNYLKVSILNEPVKIYSRGRPYLSEETQHQIRYPSGHAEGFCEAFANIFGDFASALYDKLDGVSVDESGYGYPTVDMGIAGVEFFNKCIDSYEDGSVWKKVRSESD